VCDDGSVLVIAFMLAAGIARRTRPMSLAFAVYEAWRRLSPENRERLLLAARRNAPRVASTLARRGRPRA
jgi:hypothetical protein